MANNVSIVTGDEIVIGGNVGLPVVNYDTAGNELLKDEASAGYVRITDGTTVAGVDSIEPSLVVIDLAHHEVHDGNAYRAGNIFVDVADGASGDLIIETGSAKKLHANLFTLSEGKSTAYLFSGVTYSGGTAVTAANLDLSSVNTTDATFKHTATVTNWGTLKGSQLITGGYKTFKVGGEAKSGLEWILDVDTKYAITVTNGSGSDSDIQIGVEYYEADV